MSIAVMLAAGVVVLAIALCFAEVGSRFSGSGGPYLYARHTFGAAPGFVVGWLLWITQVGGFAAVANLLVGYLGWFWPGLQGGASRAAIITLLVLGFTLINLRGVQQAVRLNNVLTVGKLVPLVLFVVVGAFFLTPSLFTITVVPTPAAFAAAVLIAIFPYSGFEVTVALTGEMREPHRTIPAGLLAGMMLTALVYVGVQVVAVGTLPTLAISSRPLADAAGQVFGRAGALVMVLGAMVSTLGVLHAIVLAAGRVPFAMAEQGQLPAWLGAIHPRWRTPWVALIVSGAAMLAFTLASNFVSALTITVGLRVLIYLSTCAALLVLRRRADAPPAGFMLPGGTLVASLSIVTCLVLLGARPLAETRQLVLALLVGVLLWGLTGRPVAQRPGGPDALTP